MKTSKSAPQVFDCPFCNIGGTMKTGEIKAHLKNHGKTLEDAKKAKGTRHDAQER